MLWVSRLVVGMLWWHATSGLVCNYCYQADMKEDCHLNKRECRHHEVCRIEQTVMHYEMNNEQKQYTTYKMGCEHYGVCRDRAERGPGPFGYSIITTYCCCSDQCEAPDGVGQKKFDHCPVLWDNVTVDGSRALTATANRATTGQVTATVTAWILAWLLFVRLVKL